MIKLTKKRKKKKQKKNKKKKTKTQDKNWQNNCHENLLYRIVLIVLEISQINIIILINKTEN